MAYHMCKTPELSAIAVSAEATTVRYPPIALKVLQECREEAACPIYLAYVISQTFASIALVIG
jgi:hypothetical protein